MKLSAVVKYLDAQSAAAIVGYEVEGRCDYADYLLLVSAKNTVHLNALIHGLYKEVKKTVGASPIISGQSDSGWVILDSGSVVVHAMLAETRRHYDLDHLVSSFANQVDHF